MASIEENVQNKIHHMIAFIEQEANEKVEEIATKAEEEFNIEKGHIVQSQRVKIMEHYEKKQKQIELNRKIQTSNLLNNARLRVLKAKEDHIKNVLDETHKKLDLIVKNEQNYRQILSSLILQGLLQLLEANVEIKCKKKDINIAKESVKEALGSYEQMTGKKCKVTLMQDNFLPDHVSGGVELYTQNGKVRVVNSLESRLELISQQILPELKEILFGPNPNRKFKD